MQKSQNRKKLTPTSIFSHISIWGLAQKHLISIEWITYLLASVSVSLFLWLYRIQLDPFNGPCWSVGIILLVCFYLLKKFIILILFNMIVSFSVGNNYYTSLLNEFDTQNTQMSISSVIRLHLTTIQEFLMYISFALLL